MKEQSLFLIHRSSFIVHRCFSPSPARLKQAVLTKPFHSTLKLFMPWRELHYRWEYDLKASPEQLWPLVADTNRFNRDTGVPSVASPVKDKKRLTNARRRLRLYKFGMPLEWEEQPFEWIRPTRYGVTRRYLKGPVAEMRVLADLTARETGGTRLVYQVWAKPKSLIGRAVIPLQLGYLSARSFARTFQRYDALAASSEDGAASQLFTEQPSASSANFATGGRERLTAFGETLIEGGASPETVSRLVELIEQADDLTLLRLRSHALADAWNVPRHEMLELCLRATRAGLLDLQWDLLCPLCRGANESNASLSEINSQVHCEACNIDYKVNFDRSVELTFRPNASVRKIEAQDYCIGGPGVTPHIVAQQLLTPGAERNVALRLERGRYRLRTLELDGGQDVIVCDDGAETIDLRACSEGWAKDEARLSPQSSLRFENATTSEQLFVLERMTWSDQAATAAEVTALQVFRDLFATEALRPGEQIYVSSLTVLFTDLRGSTKLYREIGDATAFGHVMNHFDVLRETIASEEGAVVKTIGDAVMAVFRRPVAAVRAMLKAQRILAAPPGGMLPLQLKAGLHSGPCIAVTLNDRLDYFGSTVNMAARLEGQSTGDDIVISTAVRNDPEVRALLNDSASGLVAERFDIMLKGFDEEAFELWRIRSKG
jgi:class 3 adenylate cyclase